MGLDIDDEGVQRARADGYEAYTVDCRDAGAVGALGLEPADVVIAGEIIEHLDDPGDSSTASPAWSTRPAESSSRHRTRTVFERGRVDRGFELNHPDHVTMFSWAHA